MQRLIIDIKNPAVIPALTEALQGYEGITVHSPLLDDAEDAVTRKQAKMIRNSMGRALRELKRAASGKDEFMPIETLFED